MAIATILEQIDTQITILQQARALLAGTGATPGRSASARKPAPRQKHRLSPEGRRRIAEAVKRRWAEQRKKREAGK